MAQRQPDHSSKKHPQNVAEYWQHVFEENEHEVSEEMFSSQLSRSERQNEMAEKLRASLSSTTAKFPLAQPAMANHYNSEEVMVECYKAEQPAHLKPSHDAEAAHSSQPGAFAQPGPASSDAADCTVSSRTIWVEELDSHEQPRHSNQPSNNPRNSNTSTVCADLVDDAEAVVYAKDVQQDQFQRNVAWSAIFLVFVGAITIFCIVWITDPDGPRPGDPVCWDPITEQTAFLRCYCSNSTHHLYDTMTDKGREIYHILRNHSEFQEFLVREGVHDLNVDSCHPLNQIILHAAHLETWVTDMEDIQEIPRRAILSASVLGLTYIGLDGVRWHDDSHWTTSVTYCGWFGVECIFIDNLNELRLPNNGLSGEIPSILSLLPDLRALDLSQNNIWGAIPPELANLSLLNTVTLSELSLTGRVPSELTEMERLASLSLQRNRLTGNIPEGMFQATALGSLDLSHNALTGTLPVPGDKGASPLSILRVNNNGLTGSLHPEIASLSNLELLNLGGNNFTGTIPDALGRMPRLQFINLYSSGLHGTIPDSFCADPERLPTEILLECSNFELCECCNPQTGGSSLVRIRCTEDIPDFALWTDT